MKNKQYISLYANCIPVKGEHKSGVYDLQRGDFIDIPNDLYDFIQLFDTNNLTDLYRLTGKENHHIILEYIQFLIDKELAFILDEDEKEMFPKISKQWDYPAKISNSIIDVSEVTLTVLPKIFELLSELGCEHLYIRVKMKKPVKVIGYILDLLATSSIYSIVFEADLEVEKDISNYIDLIEAHKRIETLFLFSDKELIFSSEKIIIVNKLNFIARKEAFFTVNSLLFNESQKYNTYFNKKLYVNEKGILKNAPECNDEFGNINNLDLDDLKYIIDSSDFQKYWGVHKDKIEECKNCEYRYMCVDNRLPKYNVDKGYFFEESCMVKTAVGG
ncbi:grasp-with-spasm system SPASM domain peptide maturase [Aquimarina sp. 2201CG5-10]|uniref:grasp-with-spasm system SPASM domain peptide maturase n=1 Tax=Aquimarina callyspongiae TaxID=3098150 RepID=UPI002AB3435D|nr:grasp-with-spasm system SPASM domain peptide maturase [Aquimarina sp. 2201CG5-10]MDY8136435.1 grasp-with-spasm system SPASM domain peptide maturase [Aquimarina sp. 2201CG5-10]